MKLNDTDAQKAIRKTPNKAYHKNDEPESDGCFKQVIITIIVIVFCVLVCRECHKGATDPNYSQYEYSFLD